jgi:hypothetical protein
MEFTRSPRGLADGLEYDLELFLGGLAMLSAAQLTKEEDIVIWPKELNILNDARFFRGRLFVPQNYWKLKSLAKELPVQTHQVLSALRTLQKQNTSIRNLWEKFLKENGDFLYFVEVQKVLIRLDRENQGIG